MLLLDQLGGAFGQLSFLLVGDPLVLCHQEFVLARDAQVAQEIFVLRNQTLPVD